jgi:hypothetical protein
MEMLNNVGYTRLQSSQDTNLAGREANLMTCEVQKRKTNREKLINFFLKKRRNNLPHREIMHKQSYMSYVISFILLIINFIFLSLHLS